MNLPSTTSFGGNELFSISNIPKLPDIQSTIFPPNLPKFDSDKLTDLFPSFPSSLPFTESTDALKSENFPKPLSLTSLVNQPNLSELPFDNAKPILPKFPSLNVPNSDTNFKSSSTSAQEYLLPKTTTQAPKLTLPKDESSSVTFQTHSNIQEQKLPSDKLESESKFTSSLHSILPLEKEKDEPTPAPYPSARKEPYFKPEVHVIHLDEYDKLNVPYYTSTLRQTPPNLYHLPEAYFNIQPNLYNLPLNQHHQHTPNVILYIVKNNQPGNYGNYPYL